MGNTPHTPPTNAQMRAAFHDALNKQLPKYIDYLAQHGLDMAISMDPLDEPSKTTSGFGKRDVKTPAGAKVAPTKEHLGVDFRTILSPEGRDVKVPARLAGFALYASPDRGHGTADWADLGSGKAVVLGGVNGHILTTAHLEDTEVSVAANGPNKALIKRDQKLGNLGSTGTATADCAHTVVYKFPFIPKGGTKPDFDVWAAQNRAGFLWDHVPAEAFQKAVADFTKRTGHALRWDDMIREETEVAWGKKRAQKGAAFPANDERDRYPHVYKMVEYLVNYYQGKSWPAAMGERPELYGDAMRTATRVAIEHAMGLDPTSTLDPARLAKMSPEHRAQLQATELRLQKMDTEMFELSKSTPNAANIALRNHWVAPGVKSEMQQAKQDGNWLDWVVPSASAASTHSITMKIRHVTAPAHGLPDTTRPGKPAERH